MNSPDPVLLSSTDGVTTITLNRPERKNAIDESMWRTLTEMLLHLRNDRPRRVANDRA